MYMSRGSMNNFEYLLDEARKESTILVRNCLDIITQNYYQGIYVLEMFRPIIVAQLPKFLGLGSP